MIKENQKILNVLNIITDAVLLVFAMLCAFAVRTEVIPGYIYSYPLKTYMIIAVIFAAASIVLYYFAGLYSSFRAKTISAETVLILRSTVISAAVVIVGLFIFKTSDFSRLIMVMFIALSILSVSLKHVFMRLMLRAMRAKGFNIKRTILIGKGDAARQYLDTVQENKNYGFYTVGYVSDEETDSLDVPYLGKYNDLEKILDREVPDEAIIALSIDEYKETEGVVRICEKMGTKISIIPIYNELLKRYMVIDQIENIPIMNVRRIPLENIVNAAIKRVADILGALILIVLTSPVMLFAAVGTRLTSKGPVIFKQERLGRNKVPFEMYKFRSMRINDSEQTGWTTQDDPRKTKFGAFIRKYSIDELPQLFNVLKGEMSLVGPRPELKHFAEQFKEEIPLYMVKHQVRPGMTGWAQVCGYRGDTSIEERIKHDIYYIERWTIGFDIKILIMTAFGGMINKEQTTSADKGRKEPEVQRRTGKEVALKNGKRQKVSSQR